MKKIIFIASLVLSFSTLANEFKSHCLGYGPSIDRSESFMQLIYIQDPYIYNREENKVDRESGLIHGVIESCTASSNGFLGHQIAELSESCESSGGTPNFERIDNQEGFRPLVDRDIVIPSYETREQVTCAQETRPATPIEIYEDNNPFKPVPLHSPGENSSISQGAQL
jgi:hypothetical protein